MVVIADTSPLNYLILIEAVDILQSLYRDSSWPDLYRRAHGSGISGCCEALDRGASRLAPRDECSQRQQPRLSHLDAGERGPALSLALEIDADLVLNDDRDGRQAARDFGLRIAGTLRILADAAAAGAIDLPDAFERLRHTIFRINPALMQTLLNRAASS
jgi:predicted nucleic acid-binding protein